MRPTTMRLLPITAGLLLTLAGAAQAGTVSYTATPLAGGSFLQLQQFDPTLGQLQQIALTLQGEVSGMIRAEAMSNGGPITLTLRSSIALDLPGASTSPLLAVTPEVQHLFVASSYDGVRDYAGTSGITFSNQLASASTQASFGDAGMLAAFSGPGSLDLAVTRQNLSTVLGPSNVRFGFTVQSVAAASVTYTYLAPVQPPVPEPGTWALLAAGLVAVGLKASRQRG